MELKKRNCDIEMHLERCKICGQRGFLKINGEEFPFATTDGCGQFFGQLMHVMYCLLLLPDINRNAHIGLNHTNIGTNKKTISEGEVMWDYRGKYVLWKISRDSSNAHFFEDFVCTLKIETHYEKRAFELEFRELCYAVAKCGTEVLKRYGIVGYTNLAEQYEDFNVKEFIEIKAFALNKEREMSWLSFWSSDNKFTSLEKEIELLLFDM